MDERKENDPLLLPFLGARTAEEREAALEALLCQHAYEPIDRALNVRYRQSNLSPGHREDLRAEILLRLVNRLHRLAHDRDAEPLASFGDYVSVVAFNTFDTFLRRTFPLHSRLKNRIRHALRHDPRLAEWQSGGEWIGGLSRWSERSIALSAIDPPPTHASSDLRAVLVAMLEAAGHPVTVAALVTAMAELYDLPAEIAQPLDELEAVAQRDIAADLANASFLRQVWAEIRELPLRQRIALLLNARDAAGESIVRFLPSTGIASTREIGHTLAIDPSELEDLWNDLPLEDTRIAVILQVTRQQVINLRQAARHRLARRLRRSGR